jgi:hypothetical protein
VLCLGLLLPAPQQSLAAHFLLLVLVIAALVTDAARGPTFWWNSPPWWWACCLRSLKSGLFHETRQFLVAIGRKNGYHNRNHVCVTRMAPRPRSNQ